MKLTKKNTNDKYQEETISLLSLERTAACKTQENSIKNSINKFESLLNQNSAILRKTYQEPHKEKYITWLSYLY